MRLPVPGSALARFEIQRFRSPLSKVALVFVLCVPLLYSAVYLSANWDPYGKVDRLPVAGMARTAGGEVPMRVVMLRSVDVNGIEVRGVEAAVIAVEQGLCERERLGDGRH